MILIVDDKKENIFSLKTLLQLHSYDVDTADSGEQALKKVLKNEYALIILDVQMPEMDGYEVAETITGYSRTKNIPIIFLSAVNIDKRFISRGYASGAVEYVTKPFDPDLLLLKVKTFIRLYEQTRELQRISGSLKDEVEKRKSAQQALENLNEELEEKVRERTRELLQINNDLEMSNAELQQYAYVASHDLQEPLRKIITFSHLIKERYLVDTRESANYIQKVIVASERMRKLITDLLHHSKLSLSTPFSLVNLNTVINETLNDLEIIVVEKEARFHIEELPTMEAIDGQMRQLFQNLIGNALKFSNKSVRPEITIRGERIEEKNLTASSTPLGDYLRIFIQDNGIGFDEKYLPKMFNLFQRLHAVGEYEGTGIGLAIVKKIVEKHNGLLTANSSEGNGTTFIIVLPIKQPIKSVH